MLPLPRALSHPDMLALSLGTNVGVIHLSLRGPAVRRSVARGCTCWCGNGCMVPICGSPPCVPAASIVLARALNSFWLCATSEQCRTAAAAACCCCAAAGMGALVAVGASDGGRVFDVTSGLRSATSAVNSELELA